MQYNLLNLLGENDFYLWPRVCHKYVHAYTIAEAEFPVGLLFPSLSEIRNHLLQQILYVEKYGD